MQYTRREKDIARQYLVTGQCFTYAWGGGYELEPKSAKATFNLGFIYLLIYVQKRRALLVAKIQKEKKNCRTQDI
jgi:hypothetical protein